MAGLRADLAAARCAVHESPVPPPHAAARSMPHDALPHTVTRCRMPPCVHLVAQKKIPHPAAQDGAVVTAVRTDPLDGCRAQRGGDGRARGAPARPA